MVGKNIILPVVLLKRTKTNLFVSFRPGQHRTRITMPKTNTVLQYNTTPSDPKNWRVNCWGFPALAQEPVRRARRQTSSSPEINNNLPVELFKLHLADNLRNYDKPYLPKGLN